MNATCLKKYTASPIWFVTVSSLHNILLSRCLYPPISFLDIMARWWYTMNHKLLVILLGTYFFLSSSTTSSHYANELSFSLIFLGVADVSPWGYTIWQDEIKVQLCNRNSYFCCETTCLRTMKGYPMKFVRLEQRSVHKGRREVFLPCW